jgi:hypothetical protein
MRLSIGLDVTPDASSSDSADAGQEAVPVDDPLALAAGYVRATKLDDDPASFRQALASLDREVLAAALGSDGERVAFWLNVYNATVQDVLSANPELFEKHGFPPRRPIFRRELVTVAGESLRLDDVEHGILRNSQSGVGLGYVPRFRKSAFERAHRVAELDPRVHFALNCGARSCPPVLAYDAADVDAQLDAATRSYLETEVSYDPESDVARVPKLFSWYRGDFGGKPGIRAFLRDHDAIPETADPSLAWADYDWSLKLGQFSD